MARGRASVSLGELHLEAMKLLVASLEKRRFASGVSKLPRRRGATNAGTAIDARRSPEAGASEVPRAAHISATAPVRGRYIPAALRREVYERDGGRCTYVDARGERCCETHYLEVHHLQPFAQGGAHRASNLVLRCAAHNRLAAEQDFGPGLIAARSDAARHESLSKQRGREPGGR